jgi:hypothetical protein
MGLIGFGLSSVLLEGLGLVYGSTGTFGLGILFGAIWSFIDGFITGLVIAGFYNLVMCCWCRKKIPTKV